MVKNPTKQRLVAFFTHLCTSLIVFIALFSVIYFAWFPYALIEASGGLEGLSLIAGVDLILGPLLTLVIYDISKKKWELIRDIGTILTLQITCLVGGTIIVYQAKPLAVIHVHDTFHVFRKDDFNALNIDWTKLDTFSGGYPKILYVNTEKEEAARLTKEILDSLNKKLPLRFRLDSYKKLPHNKDEITSILHLSGGNNDNNCITQKITSTYNSGTICFHPETFIFTNFSH